MRLQVLLALAGVFACSAPGAQVVHDTVYVHDTVKVPAKGVAAGRSSAPKSVSVYDRCLAAARLQVRAHDETFGAPSALQSEARDANNQGICKTMPEIYLPELR